MIFLGGVNAPPAGHAEDIYNTRKAVEQVPPAAVKPYAFAGKPPAAGHTALEETLKVGSNSNKDVDGNNNKGPGFEPVFFTDSPFVFNHHKAYAADIGSIKFCVMEPAVHMNIGGVVESPFGSPCGAGIDGDVRLPISFIMMRPAKTRTHPSS